MSFVKHDKYPILKWKYVSICPFLGKFLNFTIKRKRKKLLWKIIWSVGGLNPGLLGERQLWLPQDYGDPRNSGKNVFIVIAKVHFFYHRSFFYVLPSQPQAPDLSNWLLLHCKQCNQLAQVRFCDSCLVIQAKFGQLDKSGAWGYDGRT